MGKIHVSATKLVLVEGSYLLSSGGWQACPHAPSSSWVIPFTWGKGNQQKTLPLSHAWKFWLTLMQTILGVHPSHAPKSSSYFLTQENFHFTVQLTQRHCSFPFFLIDFCSVGMFFLHPMESIDVPFALLDYVLSLPSSVDRML